MADWPLWKVVAVSGFAFGFLAGLLCISTMVRPRLESSVPLLMTGLLVLAGVGFSVWRRLTRSWWASVGVAVALTVLLMAIGIRFWSILVQGPAYWVIVGIITAAYIAAWALPVISPALSHLLWREQTAPETHMGRAILRWSLALGLGGAGIVGATSGSTLVRAGAESAAYAFVAVGASLATVFLAQSIAHNLWKDRMGANQASSLPKDVEG